MIYLIIILISLITIITIYVFILTNKKNRENFIIGIVDEVTKNYILINANGQKYFVQLTEETDFNGVSWSNINTNQTVSIEHTDLITTSTYYQTFGKKVII